MRTVRIDTDGVRLTGDLDVPARAVGVVAFAHGSGSSRTSPRNRHVAVALGAGGLGTLLFDLLTPEEERVDLVTRELRFDIPRLARRLVGAVDFLVRDPSLPIGLFGASTGAAAALIAAAARPERVRAVVSRGGRPDLAGDALPRVRAPVLLLVGSEDRAVLALNREAQRRMTGTPAELSVVRGAGHLFEEPGTLDEVVSSARAFFAEHLRLAASPQR